jgi:lysophospholipase L1-like esterase
MELVGLLAALAVSMPIPPNHPLIATMGRLDRTDPLRPRLGFPGLMLRVRFNGPHLSMRVADTSGGSAFDVIVDGGEPQVVRCAKGEDEYVLAEGLTDAVHTADIVRRTETWEGVATFLGLRLAPGKELLAPIAWPTRKLLFIGDSVTAGEGVERGAECRRDPQRFSNARVSYGMLLARTLDAQVHLVAFGGRGLIRDWRGKRDVLNAPEFFDLALPDEDPQTPPPRFDHLSYVPDAVFVSLGTNDFNLEIGPLPGREEYVSNYVRFVQTIRTRYPAAHVFLTEGALVDDTDDAIQKPRTTLRSYIDDTISRLADPRVYHAWAEHYWGGPCDGHPSAEQHRLMARDFEPFLRRILGW